jgi:hypothetical protein
VEENPMLQRALQVTHPHLAPEITGIHERLNVRGRLRALVERFLLVLRRLGEFFAAGGPMS